MAVDPTNTDILYAEFQNRNITKSTNGGSSFSDATNGIVDTGLFITPFVMDPSNSQRLWTGGEFLWRTVNGASSWTKASVQINGTVSAIAVAPTNPNRVLAGTDTEHIHRTDVGLGAGVATNWPSVQPRSGFVSSIGFHPQDEKTPIAVSSKKTPSMELRRRSGLRPVRAPARRSSPSWISVRHVGNYRREL